MFNLVRVSVVVFSVVVGLGLNAAIMGQGGESGLVVCNQDPGKTNCRAGDDGTGGCKTTVKDKKCANDPSCACDAAARGCRCVK